MRRPSLEPPGERRLTPPVRRDGPVSWAANSSQRSRRTAHDRWGRRERARRLDFVTRDEALATLRGLGLREFDVQTLYAHFDDSERRGKLGHGHSRIAWLETVEFDPAAVPELRRRGGRVRALGRAAGRSATSCSRRSCDGLLERPPGARAARRLRATRSRLACSATGRGSSRRAGSSRVLTATSPRRLAHPAGGEPLTGTNPLAIAIPSSDGRPLVADVSMGAITWGDVIAGLADAPEELVPFGGEQAHKAFALAVGLQLLVDALAGPRHGAVLVVARPEHDPVPAFRELAAGRCRATPGRDSGLSPSAGAAGKRGSSRIASRSASSGRVARAHFGSSSTARRRWPIASSVCPAERLEAGEVVEQSRRVLALLREPCPQLGEAALGVALLQVARRPRTLYSQAEISCEPGLPPIASTVVPGSAATAPRRTRVAETDERARPARRAPRRRA